MARLVGGEDFNADRVAHGSNALRREGYAHDVSAGGEVDFESFVELDGDAIVLGARA